MKAILDPDGLKSKALQLTQLAFALSLGWILDKAFSWWGATIVSAIVSLFLARVQHRRSRSSQVFLQTHSVLATMAVMLAAPAVVLLVRCFGHPQSSGQFSVSAVILGFVMGFEIRRSGAQASAPEVPEFGAGGRKARFFLALAFALPPFRELEFPSTLYYAFALSTGVLAHACLRSMHRRAWLRVQNVSQNIDVARRTLTVAEDEALVGLIKPFVRSRPAAAAPATFAGQMIAAVRCFEDAKIPQAGDHLQAASALAPNDIERAKAVVIQAAICQALGKEKELKENLARTRLLYGECPVATVAEITLAPDTPKSRDAAELDLNRLLRAEAAARTKQPETITDLLVGRMFGVDRTLFMVAKARAYFQMDNLGEANGILTTVLSFVPRNGLARLHLGMVFVAKRNRARSDKEKSDYYDIAVIQFELAKRYSPEDSITAKRAKEQLARLHDRASRAQGGEPPIGAQPPCEPNMAAE